MTKLICQNPDCTLPEGGVCARSEEFEDPLQDCPNLQRPESREPEATPVVIEAPDSPVPPRDSASEAPWSGRHLSESEADWLMRASPARVFGIVGPFSAGKTCLLTSLFLQLADGQCERLGYRFASSRTLFALQTLCQELTAWDGQSNGLMVAHTPKSETREVGSFIHLGLRPASASDNRHIDILLGDVAGEHFSEYASLADEQSTRRMAFLRRCDGFIVVIDALALFGPKYRQLDAALARMCGRLLDTLHDTGRLDVPIAIVLSKADAVPQVPRPVPSDARSGSAQLRQLLDGRARRVAEALRRADAGGVPTEVFAVGAIPAEGQPFGVQEPFRYLLSYADRRDRWPRWVPPIADTPTSSFMAMRSWRDEA